MNADAWVKKAIKPKSHGRMVKEQPYEILFRGDGKMIATDNHRAHLWFDSNITDVGNAEFPLSKVLELNERGRKATEVCEFSTYSVKKACTMALSFFKKNNGHVLPHETPYVYAHIYPEKFELATTVAEVGGMHFALQNGDKWNLKKSSHDLFYKFKQDSPIHFYVDPKYLKQALEGMGESATLRKDGGLLHFLGETGAEAVVMCLNFKSFEKFHTPYILEAEQKS